jgi:hypothetical protein
MANMKCCRLIKVLQTCFSDLAKKQEEEGDKSAILFVASSGTVN